MPAKNIIKQYLENGIYHIYNRGTNKQNIFLDDKDCSTFLFYLKLYLNNPKNLKNLDPQKRKYLARRNFYEQIDLLCYCLMPNHFHLLLRQKGQKDISGFMRCIATNYSMYFNRRHKRIGPFFQGRYKAVLVDKDNYLLHLSRYIHLNPLAKGRTLGKGKAGKIIENYPYSSYANYAGSKNTTWVKPDFILEYFEENKDTNLTINKSSSYKKFVENNMIDSEKIIGGLILEK